MYHYSIPDVFACLFLNHNGGRIYLHRIIQGVFFESVCLSWKKSPIGILCSFPNCFLDFRAFFSSFSLHSVIYILKYWWDWKLIAQIANGSLWLTLLVWKYYFMLNKQWCYLCFFFFFFVDSTTCFLQQANSMEALLFLKHFQELCKWYELE